MLLLCMILTLGFVSVSGTDCPDRWTAYEGSCYLFGHTIVDFTEAEHYCSQEDSRAHLVTVDGGEENGFIKAFIADFHAGNSFWMGMTDEAAEGFWKWQVDHSQVEFFDWGPTEPQNGGNNEDCAGFAHRWQYQWADFQCGVKMMPLCEIR